MPKKPLDQLSLDESSLIIRMAWEDRTSFDQIEKRTGLRESDVLKLMRNCLKPSSFRLWRKRVTGRITKHDKPFRHSRSELKRHTQQLRLLDLQ